MRRETDRYRALLEEGEAVATVAKWIAEVERERETAQAQLGRVVPGGKLTKSQVRALVEALHDIVEVLADADPQDKAELDAELGVSLTYHTTDGSPSRRSRVGYKYMSEGGLPA